MSRMDVNKYVYCTIKTEIFNTVTQYIYTTCIITKLIYSTVLCQVYTCILHPYGSL